MEFLTGALDWLSALHPAVHVNRHLANYIEVKEFPASHRLS